MSSFLFALFGSLVGGFFAVLAAYLSNCWNFKSLEKLAFRRENENIKYEIRKNIISRKDILASLLEEIELDRLKNAISEKDAQIVENALKELADAKKNYIDKKNNQYTKVRVCNLNCVILLN